MRFVLSQGLGEAEARMMSFASLVIANLGLILTNRSWTRSIAGDAAHAQPGVVVGGRRRAGFPGAGAWLPFLRDLFSFGPLHLWELGLDCREPAWSAF